MADNTPAWSVINQVQTTRPDASGSFVRGITVTFRLANGNVGSVFVSEDDYSAENVQALINDRAEVMQAVADLKG